MNAIFVSGLTILAATTALAAPAVSLAANACDPRVIQSETKFPIRSQIRHQTGTVYVHVTVDENGRAQSAELVRSSGYRLLDRAATQSVVGDWVFDVSSCERKDLPANHLVAVEYRTAD
ncbi:MAG: energy transducer TonB [Steroidobacter sp.]